MLPEAFLARMQQMLGDEYEVFLESFEKEKYQALRLNALKLNTDGRSAAQVFGNIGSDCGSSPDASFAHLTKVPWASLP